MTETYAQQQALIAAQITIGKLEIEVAHLTIGMTKMELSQAAQNQKLQTILDTLSQAKGGWHTLMIVGGAASSLGAGVAWLLSNLQGVR